MNASNPSNASIPLVYASRGELLIPAMKVTGLLRRVAAGWLRSTQAGGTDLDPTTALTLARQLSDLADQIDVECIAVRRPVEEPPAYGGGHRGEGDVPPAP
ncbi:MULTISPECIES: DUF6213 family protein [Streptomyces]|uniref:DUF6213 family protein n=1 Tax=Streptomyces TaxID=1883 RepID=UPI00093D1E4A|nr:MULTISPECIES: DUF6213 family protein [Streptomyces]MBX9424298.1 hypothetical protein [Streptomyces lateritius]